MRQVPKPGPAPTRSDVTAIIPDAQTRQKERKQHAYKTEIIGGVVVHTPIQVFHNIYFESVAYSSH